VQILGHRVELEEINVALKVITKQDAVISIPYPVVDGVAQSVYSFILDDCALTQKEIIDLCKKELAPYMIPGKRFIETKS